MQSYDPYAHHAGPSSSSYYHTSASHAGPSTNRLQMGTGVMNDDVGGVYIGAGAASTSSPATSFPLGSTPSYGRFDHQATIHGATVTTLRAQSPSRVLMAPGMSSLPPVESPSGYSFSSSGWHSGLMFNYALNHAPHLDASVPGPSGSAGLYSDKSWTIPQFVEPETTSSYSIQSNSHPPNPMAITQRTQRPAESPAPDVRPETTSTATTSTSANEGPRLPDIYASIPLPSTTEQTGSDRKKDGRKHACHMCHKSFDRPCTLRKHMLVHTGQKAYQCEDCQRRFSVQSNLNRHRRRCGQPRSSRHENSNSPSGDEVTAGQSPERPTTTVPSNTAEEAASTPSFSISGHLPVEAPRRSGRASTKRPAISTSTNESTSAGTAVTTTSVAGRGQKRRLELDDHPTSSPSNVPVVEVEVQLDSPQPNLVPRRPRKRARRAPSPSRWIPDSLRLFDLTRIDKSTPKPLPPVQPYQDPQTGVREERNSFDDHAPNRPYHPSGWKGKLPGPGLMRDETMKMGGTLLVF